MTAISASAPGKVMLTGEYAVLEGAPAWLIAVNRRATVTLAPTTSEHWDVQCLSADVNESLTLSVDALLKTADSPDSSTALLACVLAAQPNSAPTRRTITMDTTAFAQDNLKLGIGSSAALAVALDAAIAADRGEPPSLERAIVAHRRFQGGRGSGADVAASFQGGSVRFQGGHVARIDKPSVPPLLFVWSGVSASTPDLVKRFQGARARQSRTPLSRLVSSADAVFAAGDGAEALSAYSESLKALDDAWGIGVHSAPHQRIDAICAASGVDYKTCGAGGGDLGIAFSASEADLRQCRNELARAGFLCVELEPESDGVRIQQQPSH